MAAAVPPSPVIKVAALCGSLRKGSYNRGLLRAAIDVSKTIKGLEVEYVDISELPHLNTDLEVNGTYPAVVEAFRQKIQAADSILFASPEYNYSVTGPLKNAIDWASRPQNLWADKAAAIVSTGGGFGGGRSQYHLRQIGVYIDLHFINKPVFFLNAFQSPAPFDSDGNLIHDPSKEKLKAVLLSLYAFTLRLQVWVQDDHNFQNSACFMDADDSTPQDQGKVEKSPVETSSPPDAYHPLNISNFAVSFEASLGRRRTSDVEENVFSEPQNKAAFRMSAMEDYVDLDDDDELASHPPSDERGPLETHLTHSKLLPIEEPKFLETTSQQELESRSDLTSTKTNDVAASLGERNNGIITPASQKVTAAAQPSIPPMSAAAFDKPKEVDNPASLFSFTPKAADKFPSLMPEPRSRKPESSSSLLDVLAPTSSPVTVSEAEKSRHLKPLVAEDTNGKSDNTSSAASNGLVAGAPAGLFTATSNGNSHQIFTSAPVIFTPSVSVSDSIPSATGSISSALSSRITFGASETPKVSRESAFKFGVSPDPPTKVSATSTTIIPAGDLKNEAARDPSFGSSNGSTTNSVAFGMPSSGNMTSGLDSSTSTPSADSTLGSLFNSTSKSFLPAVGSVSQGPFTQSNSFAPPPSSNANSSSTSFSSIMPFGFNSSASSSDTGPVASSSGSPSSLFGVNSTAVSNGSAGGSSSFSTPSVFSFGLSSSSSSINAVGSTGAATAPVLSSSGSASVTTSSFSSSPALTSAVGSTGNAAAPVFSFGAIGSAGGAAAPVFGFGASSSGSASAITNSFSSSTSTNSAIGSTSGAALSGFSFGVSNPASASASNAASSFSNGAFSFGGGSSASSSAINSVNSNNAPSNPFGSSLQAPTPSVFGSSPATGFSFGAAATSSAPISAAPVVFGASTASSSSFPFSFTSAPASVFSSPASSMSQPVFGNPANGFAASSPGNNYQMNGEDSMAEDPVQSTAPSVPVFGQGNVSPSPSGFMFGSTPVPSQPNPFQFGGQQNQPIPQNPSQPNPFQASGSLEFNAGGSFSLGSGGGDKSGRKFVKANRNKNRKK